MRQAQLAIEDHRYYEHGALDFKGTMRALVRNSAAGGTTQGGSSITQQYVKMVQIEACQAKGDSECVREAQAPTMERKIRELRYAIAMEKKFTKDQILERYLNIAYYGEGAYGVEAAARHYFSSNGLQAHPGAGGDAGRAGAEPGCQQSGAQPQRGARPSRRGAQPDGRAQVDLGRAGASRPRRSASTRTRSSRPATAASAPGTRSSATTCGVPC